MLDDRPIVQKSLIGAGAFAFVFSAAMGGTAFMISGGLGLGGDQHDRAQPAQLVSAVQDTWSEWAFPDSEARTVPASLSEQTPDQPWVDPQPVSASSEDLEGTAPPQQQAAATTRSEDWVTQNAPVQYAQADDAQSGDDDADKTKDDSGF